MMRRAETQQEVEVAEEDEEGGGDEALHGRRKALAELLVTKEGELSIPPALLLHSGSRCSKGWVHGPDSSLDVTRRDRQMQKRNAESNNSHLHSLQCAIGSCQHERPSTAGWSVECYLNSILANWWVSVMWL